MDADKARQKRRDGLRQGMSDLLADWKKRPNDSQTSYSLAITLGAFRAMGGVESFSIADATALATSAVAALAAENFPARYRQLESALADREEPLSRESAEAFLQERENAQFACLAIRGEIAPPGSDVLMPLHLIMRKIVEREDLFLENHAWAFFEALEWIRDELAILDPKGGFEFGWLESIAAAAEEAWRLPLPVPVEPAAQENWNRPVDFSFVTRAFGQAFDPPITEATRPQVLDRLADTLPAHQRLAAKADALLQDGSMLMENLVRQVGVFRILPKDDLPGFFVRLRRDRAIELIFRDENGELLAAFEHARVEMAGLSVPISDGSAIVTYGDLISLYEDMANLDERLTIAFPDGARKTRFFPG